MYASISKHTYMGRR